MGLLQTTNDIYSKWLGRARTEIEQAIAKTDADCRKRRMAQEAARRTPLDELSTGSLWPCRIFASIHKFPIRHSNVKDLLPASFSPQGLRNPRTPADFLPTDEASDNGDNVFRLANGEVYVVISSEEYGRLYQQGKASSFLTERRENAADFTFCDFDEWHPVIWHPGWIKPVSHYNAPSLIKKRGLTRLDEGAYCWGQELLHEEKHLWERGGRELGWYL